MISVPPTILYLTTMMLFNHSHNYPFSPSSGDVVEPNSLHVIILAFDKYCRIRGLLKRLEGVEEEYMRSRIVVALGGFVVPSRRTRMLFCRDVFDYPELEGHDLLCNHLCKHLSLDAKKGFWVLCLLYCYIDFWSLVSKILLLLLFFSDIVSYLDI